MTNTERTEALLACLSGAVESLKSALGVLDDYAVNNVCDALKHSLNAMHNCDLWAEDDDEEPTVE
jgi:hypothetical protein